ncbi:MAG TPA: hypothetical protein VNA69_22870 [Thermoanaerobaculia bacterium]|nr:hypothetical protein [Thermoanaerobaculia bacterium]
MKPRRIDDQIREYYESHRLSDDARARLKATLRAGAPARNASRWWWIKAGIAAGFIIIVTAAALWLAVFSRSTPDSPQAIASTVARSAAEGHNERQELEFRVARTAELRRLMKSLDFTPVEPEMMAGMNMRVIGARYTTIEGVIAAQILYLDPKGEPCTLYEARPVEKLARIPNGEHDVDGLRVSVWREKGLLMVLARPIA